MSIYIYIYIYTHMYVYVCIYIYIYIMEICRDDESKKKTARQDISKSLQRVGNDGSRNVPRGPKFAGSMRESSYYYGHNDYYYYYY